MYLLIADAHYSWRKSIAPPLSEIIDKTKENYTVRKTIILGDIIDFWRKSIDDVIIEQKDNLKSISKKEIIYIKGNHDWIIDEIFPDLDIKERYKYKNIYFMHGHQFEIFSSDTPFTKESYEKIARLLCYSNNEIGKMLSIIWNGLHKCGSKRNEEKFNKIMNFIDNIYNSINSFCLFGHFHRYKRMDNVISLRALCNGYYYLLDINDLSLKEKYINKN